MDNFMLYLFYATLMLGVIGILFDSFCQSLYDIKKGIFTTTLSELWHYGKLGKITVSIYAMSVAMAVLFIAIGWITW